MLGLACLSALAPAATGTEPPTIHVNVGDRLANIGALEPGVHRYVRYLIKPDGQRVLVDLWQRKIEKAPLPGGGGPGLHITQRWDVVRDGSVLVQDSWFDARTFAPVSHVRRLAKNGETTIKGYQFAPDVVTALAGLTGAANADFRMPLSEPAFNFEYDMELFEALPLTAGKVFDIPFYDAGIDKAPARYRFAVEGSATISGWGGKPIACWVLTGDYRTGKVLNRFWITKAGHILVREQGPGWDGGNLVKTLLPPERGDST